MKRTDYINWDEYFMGIALLTAMRSKDPSSQVGACIVSPENKILSLGYNGMPIGCDDDAMPWEREGDPLDTKYMYVCHAELNAILNSAHNNLNFNPVFQLLKNEYYGRTANNPADRPSFYYRSCRHHPIGSCT